jgi:hypothetical protein
MSLLTVSELVTEECFSARGIPYERIPQSHLPSPDYRLLVDPEPVTAEVKEFGRSQKLREGGYYPVPFVREKIKACWRQFEQHRDRSCCLILYNEGSTTVFLQPELILCAMFGEYFETIGRDAYRFSGIAAMRPERNTGVSAVVGIFPLRVYRNCLETGRRIFELTCGFSRDLTEDETLQIHRETSQYLGQVESVMRAVVVENPFAPKQLSPSVVDGPFDERWVQGPDDIVRLNFSGTRIAEMRALLPEYALKMMGFGRMLVLRDVPMSAASRSATLP